MLECPIKQSIRYYTPLEYVFMPHILLTICKHQTMVCVCVAFCTASIAIDNQHTPRNTAPDILEMRSSSMSFKMCNVGFVPLFFPLVMSARGSAARLLG